MWTYNKVLQYPINIKCADPRLAKVIISQYGGPDGELAASIYHKDLVCQTKMQKLF